VAVEPLGLAGIQHEPALATRLESVFGALEGRLGNHVLDYGGWSRGRHEGTYPKE
jgi:hypothetical protein